MAGLTVIVLLVPFMGKGMEVSAIEEMLMSIIGCFSLRRAVRLDFSNLIKLGN